VPDDGDGRAVKIGKKNSKRATEADKDLHVAGGVIARGGSIKEEYMADGRPDYKTSNSMIKGGVLLREAP